MGKMRNSYIILVGKPEGRRLVGNLAVDGRIILECKVGRCGMDSSGSR
jgi:hypothetical protein